MNKKNYLGLDICFMNEDDPFLVFKKWMSEAEKNEINDPNAVALATVNETNQPDVRMVLLKEFNNNGFIFFPNIRCLKVLNVTVIIVRFFFYSELISFSISPNLH